MNEILKVLFQSIPAMLYEPIAVGAVLGLIVAAVMYWKRHTPLYWWIAFSLIFMIGWRLGIQIISRRYASILIYPAIIATAYFCFQTEWLVKYIPKFPDKWRKIVPYLFVIGLGIASIAQTLHLNPYGDYIIRAAELIKKDAEGRTEPHIFSIDHEVHRFSHYSGISSDRIGYANFPEEKYIKNIGDRLHQILPVPATHIYVILFESTKRPKGYYLQNISPGIKKHLHYLGEFYHNRKKRRVTRIYRYDYAEHFKCSVIPLSNKKSQGILHYRFDIKETVSASSPQVQYQKTYFKERPHLQMPVFYEFPKNWFVTWSPGYALGSNGEFQVVKLEDDTKVLRMKANSCITIYCAQRISPAHSQIRLSFSGQENSVAALGFHCYDKKGKWYAFKQLPAFNVPGDGRYEFKTDIPDDFFEREIKSLFPTVLLYKGELFVHSIELYSTEK